MILAGTGDLLKIFMIFSPLITAFLSIFISSDGYRKIFSIMGISISALSAISLYGYFNDVSCLRLVDWIVVGDLKSGWSICFDGISSLFCVIVTVVSWVVHIYSCGYMSWEKNRGRFFVYLQLFTFFMLALITSGDFLQLFFGWEGVGLCSYLLIGFRFERYASNEAALKAFTVNRFADVFFILAIVLIFWNFGTLDIKDIILGYGAFDFGTTQFGSLLVSDMIPVLILIACMAKSAQIGLHVWLPDAMEGPTPISALIHAATMVAAGVFLIVKCSFIFEGSQVARMLCLTFGGLTCVICALIGLTQSDIKKIIAYSTCSQLGYMFMACGASFYNAGFFHLCTHAFFKALLFLCAGNIIHSFAGEQNIHKMGGDCFRKIKVTYVLFWIGSASLSGIFPLSGFYSKDMIIENLHSSSHIMFYVLGVFVAFLTAVYSLKLIIFVFHKSSNTTLDVHESPSLMTFPLFILTIFSIVGGFLYVNLFSSPLFFKENFIYFVSEHKESASSIISLIPTFAALFGFAFAYFLYGGKRYNKVFPMFILSIFDKRLYFDELYTLIFVIPYRYLSKMLSGSLEVLIDFFFVTATKCSVFSLSRGSLVPHIGSIKYYHVFVVSACLVGMVFLYISSF